MGRLQQRRPDVYVETKRVLRLNSQAACRSADPTLFDANAWTPEARVALRYCLECPVQLLCLTVVVTPASFYDGVAGGMVWRNGRPVRPPRKEKR
jgi:hypothetical protein